MIKGDPQIIPRNPLGLAAAIAVIVTFGFGLGLINSAFQSMLANWANLFALVFGPLYLLSGVWFVPDQVPMPLRAYLLYNPLVHLILWFRSGFYPPYATTYLDRSYAVTWAIALLIFGLILQRVLVRKILEPS